MTQKSPLLLGRRGQVSHVFMIIFTLVVFATIFVFGYRAISGIVRQGDETAFIQFKTDIEKSMHRVMRDVDSVMVHTAKNPLRVPGKYDRVCFVDVDLQPPADCPPELGIIACDAWTTAYKESDQDARTFDAWEHADANVFAHPAGPFAIKTTPLRLNGNSYICIVTPGRLDIRLTGKGSYTLVSPVGGS